MKYACETAENKVQAVMNPTKTILTILISFIWLNPAIADREDCELNEVTFRMECKTIMTLSTGEGFDGPVVRRGKYAVGDLLIQHFEQTLKSGKYQFLEVSGEIGPDSTFFVKSLLQKFAGEIGYILLNSAGAAIKDGLSLAEAINGAGIEALISSKGECASSCAVAFLGADNRYMFDGATLSFHSPYYALENGYRCTEIKELKTLFTRQLGASSGSFAYARMMDFCGPNQVWTLNKDAADLMGMSNIRDVLTRQSDD